MFFHPGLYKIELFSIKRKVLFLIYFLFVVTIQLTAQDALLCNGGNASGRGGNISFSIGQIVYTTAIENDITIAQGVQQAYEISVIAGAENETIYAYPNPTNGDLTLKINEVIYSDYSYQVYDLTGKLLKNEKIEENLINIDLFQLNNAIYFLNIIEDSRKIKTFKIIKY